jgi:hypothetical protein
MKIFNREEFLKLPEGILYRKMAPNNSLETIEIKSESLMNGSGDFVCAEFANCSNELEELAAYGEIGASRPIRNDYYGRDGCFELDALFFVYETWDLEQMRLMIDQALKVAPKSIFEKPWDTKSKK